MDLSSWIALRFRRATRRARPGRLPGRRHRPTLELLEDRFAPATLVVNTLADSTGGTQLSLRDAILAVNGGSYSGPATGQVSGTFGSNDTILFQSGLNGTLSLVTASGPLVISSNLTITANPTLNLITISGQFAGSQTGVFLVMSTGTATIAGLTITQGKDSVGMFGGIYVQAGGALTVNGCTFVNNQSAGPGGGAILNAGTLTVTNSTFTNNSGVQGGAIDNQSGATATLINCTISGNQATTGSGSGGGVVNAGTLTLLNTLVAENTSAGSDPDVAGAFTSSGHNLIGNATGSTGLTDGVNGDQVGSAAPFTGDVTSGLAAIDNVSNTAGLVVGQLITDTAGAIPAGTIIAVLGPHSITLSQAATASHTGDTFTSSVYANLGPLQNNGGSIQTMALLPTSSAIDAGANTDPVLTVPTVDERGVSRPQAGTVDIGAFEASQILVTNLNDSGAGSLRDALTQSNGIPGTVVIDFQAGLTGTISLTTARLEVVHDDWIRGPGASQITVDGNLNFWCFGVDSQYTVGAPGLHVAIYGLTMTRGEQVSGLNDTRGGAISYRNCSPFDCRLTVANCTIQNSVNQGIYAEDTLSVINCQIINNTGQGIYGGTPYVSNSWIAGNTKEGLNGFNDLVLVNSTFSSNGTGTTGDGVYMGNRDATVTNCTFTANHGRGFVINYQDTALLTNCTLVSNVGSDLLSIGGNAIPRNSIVSKLDTQNGFGAITSEGNNLFGFAAPAGATELASDVTRPALGSSLLGPLASNGGPAPTMAPTAAGCVYTNNKANPAFALVLDECGYLRNPNLPGIGAFDFVIGLFPALPTDTLNTAYNHTQNISGGSGSFSAPNVTGLPSGLTASFSGTTLTISGTPAVSGTFPLSITVHDDGNNSVSNVISESLTVNPALIITTTSLPDWTETRAYNQSIATTGGTAPLTFSLSAGTLPAGLSLNSTTGQISGTPSQGSAGGYPITVAVNDAAGASVSGNFTININVVPSLGTLAPSQWTVGRPGYTGAIPLTGGTGAITVSAQSSLPPSLSATVVGSNVVFTGTPTTVGTYGNVHVTVKDATGATSTGTFSIIVNPAPSLGTLSSTAWTVNTPGFSGTIGIAAGTGPFGNLTATGLPAGLTASLSGGTITISGMPIAAGTFNTINISVQDAAGAVRAGTFSITVNATPTLGTLSSTAWTMNLPGFSGTTTVSGGTGAYGGLTASNLPPGLTASLSGSTITLSGTPTSAGTYDTTLSVTDAAGAIASRTYTMVINAVSLGALSFNQWTNNKSGFIGEIAAGTGTGAFTLSLTSGKLPTGMTDSVSGGLITFAGKPTVAGTYPFTLKVTDSLGVTATQSYTIIINPGTTFVWTGLGADDNWMTPGNWSGAGAAPVAGDTLIFGPPTTQKTANNNFPSGTTFAALSFQDQGYTITGNNLKLSAGISSTSTSGGTDTVALGVALTATETFNIAGTTLIDMTGTISGTGLGITKTGAGTLAYDSPAGNTYTGLTTVSGGTLELNTSNQIVDTASVTVNVGAVFDLNGHDETIANLTLTGGTVDTGTGTLTLLGNVTSNAATPSATINGNLHLIGTMPTLTVSNGAAVNDLVIVAAISANSLTKLGTGTLVLSGNNASYTGTTKVQSGVLDVQNPAALGSGPVVALSGTTVQLDGNGLTAGNSLTLGSTGGATLGNLAGSNTWSGPVTDAVTSTINVSNGTLTVNGPISGAGGLTKSGTGTLLLPGANNYMGLTTVNAGILDVETPAALGNNTSLTVAALGTLQIDGTGLTFSKTLNLSGTLANPNGSNTWSGKISTLAATSTVNIGAGQSLTLGGIISGAGGLTDNKSGSGTLILTNANTYTGATTIDAGITVVGNKTALGSGATTVFSGATLQLQGGLTIANRLTLNGVGAVGTTGALESVSGTNTCTGTISLASASTIAIDAGQLTTSGIISGVGSLTKAGAGSLIVSATNTYTGGTTVNGGTLGGGGKIGALLVTSGATIAPDPATTKILKTGNVAFSAGSTFAVTLVGSIAGTGYDQLSVQGTVNLAGATLNVNLAFTPVLGSAFTLIQNDGTDAVVGTFAGLLQDAQLSLNGMTFQISYVGGTGNDVVLTRIA